MRIVVSLLKMVALVYLLVSLAFGTLTLMMSGNIWQAVSAVVLWPAAMFRKL